MISYSNVILPFFRLVFIGTLLTFFLTWLARKILCVIESWRKSHEPNRHGDNTQKETEYNIKRDAWTHIIQQEYQEKADKYRENVLIPRARKKRERIERQYLDHFGPLWSGKGATLGDGRDVSDEENDRSCTTDENRRSARIRKIPEPEHPKTTITGASKQKRVVELPDEAEETDPDSVLITMRTPISTLVTRRFHLRHSFQNVLDFMTKSGFSQHRYQLCTSFPRKVLSHDPEVHLSEVEFGRRVILNIEEKSDDE